MAKPVKVEAAGAAALKPSQVMRLTKREKLPHSIKGGRVCCEQCHHWSGGCTESPMFWENGSYVHCDRCQAMTLARPLYPATPLYPQGFWIDLTGERKKYPLVLDRAVRITSS